ncbi:MAG: hypothetical protein L3J25_01675 [Flavobacteriaceae bacterium]|nr:hypothetical protein [Flavobacteriaceae bacterium]
MKKILILFVLMFGIMSFANSDVTENALKLDSNPNEKVCTTCCTVDVYYMGQYHSSYTSCAAGCGSASEIAACGGALVKAKKAIE